MGTGGAGAFCSHDAQWTSWRTNLVNEKSKQMTESFKKQRMSIGGQIQILKVMQQEEKHKRASWQAEWKCAERLLFAQGDQTAIEHDQDMVRKFEKKTAHTLSTPVGGGYAYRTFQRKLGLEDLFEHK